jgi:DNA-binding IclR family transcriptional regulator
MTREAQKVLAALSTEQATETEIAGRAGLSLTDTHRALSELAVLGGVKSEDWNGLRVWKAVATV